MSVPPPSSYTCPNCGAVGVHWSNVCPGSLPANRKKRAIGREENSAGKKIKLPKFFAKSSSPTVTVATKPSLLPSSSTSSAKEGFETVRVDVGDGHAREFKICVGNGEEDIKKWERRGGEIFRVLVPL